MSESGQTIVKDEGEDIKKIVPMGFAPAAMLAAVSLEDEADQLTQPDIGTVSDDLRTYKLSAVLNGVNSRSYGDNFTPPAKWLQLADPFYDASMARSDGRPRSPVIWGNDSAYGNNNIVGATLFPHNIGLVPRTTPT